MLHPGSSSFLCTFLGHLIIDQLGLPSLPDDPYVSSMLNDLKQKVNCEPASAQKCLDPIKRGRDELTARQLDLMTIPLLSPISRPE